MCTISYLVVGVVMFDCTVYKRTETAGDHLSATNQTINKGAPNNININGMDDSAS